MYSDERAVKEGINRVLVLPVFAAMFFITLALEEGVVHESAWPSVALVVALSTVAHGVTAVPPRHLPAFGCTRGGEREGHEREFLRIGQAPSENSDQS